MLTGSCYVSLVIFCMNCMDLVIHLISPCRSTLMCTHTAVRTHQGGIVESSIIVHYVIQTECSSQLFTQKMSCFTHFVHVDWYHNRINGVRTVFCVCCNVLLPRLWFPCVDTYTELCTWTLKFVVPASMTAISVGDLTEQVCIPIYDIY